MSDQEFDPESVDLTQPIYPVAPEAQVQPSVGIDYDQLESPYALSEEDETEMQAQDYDLFTVLHRIENKLDALTGTTDGVRTGVNTIGEMMNSIADAVGQVMQKVNQGGIGALLGGMMGGKNDG